MCFEVARRFFADPTGSNHQLLVLRTRIYQWQTYVFAPKEYDLSLVLKKPNNSASIDR